MRSRLAAKAAKGNKPETYTAPGKPSMSIPNPRTKDQKRQARHEAFLKSLPPIAIARSLMPSRNPRSEILQANKETLKDEESDSESTFARHFVRGDHGRG